MSRLLGNLLKGHRPYVLSLVLLNLFFFGDVLFTERTFFYRDIGNFHHPLKKLVTESYSRGEWPLWNTNLQFGQPLLANPNAMAVYPTQILFHLLPFNWAFDFNLTLNCLIAGLGAFFLARGLGLTSLAAFVVGVAYNFSGVILSFVNLPLLAGTAALLPWLAVALWRVVRGPTWANVACSGLAIGLFLLLVEPVTFTASLLFLLPFGLYAWMGRPAGLSSRLVVGALFLALVSGFCLAAVQLLPMKELLDNSGRNQGLDLERASYWSLHPVSLSQMLFPSVWEDPFNLSNAFTSWSDVFYGKREAYIASCYWGLSCLVLVLLALFFSEKTALKWIITAVSLIALFLALGPHTPLYSVLHSHLPFFRLGRYPVKYCLTSTLGFALLTGLGIDRLARLRDLASSPYARRRFVAFLLLVLGLLAASLLLTLDWTWLTAGAHMEKDLVRVSYQGTPIAISQSAIRYAVLYLWLVVVAVSGLVLLAFSKMQVRPSWLAALITVVIVFDLFNNHWINPCIDSVVYERSPVTEWLQRQSVDGGPFRIHNLNPRQTTYSISGRSDSLIWYFFFQRLTASPYTAAGDHLQYSTFHPIDGLETYASQIIDREFGRTAEIERQLDYLARLNTGYVLSLEPIRSSDVEWAVSFRLNSNRLLHVYRLKRAVPRAFVTGLQTTKPVKGGYDIGNGLPLSGSAVTVASYTAGRIDLAVTGTQPGLMVLLDSYYPGWRVWVDGREGRIELVNRAFRGVMVTPGRHQITFRYVPSSFRRGLALTLATLGAWMVALGFIYGRRYRRRISQRSTSAME